MLKKASHVCFMVKDLEESIPVYERLFRLKAERMPPFPSGVRTANLTLPGGLDIELFQPAPDTDGAKWLAANGEGIHHLCLEVDNVDAELAQAAKNGAQLVTPKSRKAGPFTIGFARAGATGGVLIEYLPR